MRSMMKLALAAVATAAASPALAIDDGPRAYFPLPVGTNNFNLMGVFQNSNSSFDPATAVKGAKVNIDVGVAQYTRTLDIGGNSAALAVVVPFGEVRGSVTVNRPIVGEVTRSGASSGLGDISLLGIYGIVGSPAMTRQQYVQQPTGFALGAMVWATAPTGEYDPNKAINLGTNRWAFRVGAPLGWTFGGSYVSPKLTTLEFVPSVTFYTVNDAPFRAGRVTQSPLFRMEGHATHNFNRAIWGSFDAGINSGGETTTDGVKDDNGKFWIGLGVTAGVNLSPAFGISATYGGIAAGNSNAPDGDGFRVNARFTF